MKLKSEPQNQGKENRKTVECRIIIRFFRVSFSIKLAAFQASGSTDTPGPDLVSYVSAR
jgi:hypothetical protein